MEHISKPSIEFFVLAELKRKMIIEVDRPFCLRVPIKSGLQLLTHEVMNISVPCTLHTLCDIASKFHIYQKYNEQVGFNPTFESFVAASLASKLLSIFVTDIFEMFSVLKLRHSEDTEGLISRLGTLKQHAKGQRFGTLVQKDTNVH